MTELDEKDLRIRLPAGASGRKFDDDATHGLSHCMKRVDFIVEMEDRILFIEFKDPDHPSAVAKGQQEFMEEFRSGALDNKLKTKYRDSFLYEWGAGRVSKPVYYLVLIAASVLTEADLLIRTDALKRQLPVLGPGDEPWKKPFVAGCAVMNIKKWNEKFPDFPVIRLSA